MLKGKCWFVKIRKFEAPTETEAIQNVKDELGLDALVLSIRKIQPKGMFSIFRKATVEVTAACTDKDKRRLISHVQEDLEFKKNQNDFEQMFKEKTIEKTIDNQNERIKTLEGDLHSAESMLEKAMKNLSISYYRLENRERKYSSNLIQIFYEALIKQGVLPEIASEMLDDLDLVRDDGELSIPFILKVVYSKIMEIIGAPETIKTADRCKIVVFIGSTGVGKTTTIAKLSADFILAKGHRVGLITADTYRIAAVEQLKTYAEILGLDVSVVYNTDDLSRFVNEKSLTDDVIFIDTAGRSHKNAENLRELLGLLNVVPNSEKFLVMSMTTKYEDMLNIIETYSSITDFKIIFTKLDETTQYGSILNICKLTGKKISYVTTGQNVPDDIEVISVESLSRVLLGLGEF